MLVKVSFRLKVGELIDSNIMQLYPLTFAKDLISSLMNTEESPAEETTPEPEVTYEQPKEPVMPEPRNEPQQQAPAKRQGNRRKPRLFKFHQWNFHHLIQMRAHKLL